jgi:hypothetical protein
VRRIWKHLSFETKIDILLSAGTGIVWFAYFISRVNKIVEHVDGDVEFLQDYCEADIKATLALYAKMSDEDLAVKGQQVLEGEFNLQKLWPGGPTFM